MDESAYRLTWFAHKMGFHRVRRADKAHPRIVRLHRIGLVIEPFDFYGVVDAVRGISLERLQMVPSWSTSRAERFLSDVEASKTTSLANALGSLSPVWCEHAFLLERWPSWIEFLEATDAEVFNEILGGRPSSADDRVAARIFSILRSPQLIRRAADLGRKGVACFQPQPKKANAYECRMRNVALAGLRNVSQSATRSL